MQVSHRIARRCGAALFAAAASIAGCGGGSGGSGGSVGASGDTGVLRVSLTDAPACGYEAVNVTVAKVLVHKSAGAADGDAGWVEVGPPSPRRVDLLTLQNGVLQELGSATLAAGVYQQVRLLLADNAAVPMANSVVPVGRPEVALDTPSGQQTGLKLRANFEVPAGLTADLVIDFDACRSVVPRGASGRFNLTPVVSVVPLLLAGQIRGQVDPALVSSGVRVSAQSAGVEVKATLPDSAGAFVLAPVPQGTYDVVFTASGRASAVVTGVPVTVGGSTLLGTPTSPVALALSGSAVVRGSVSPLAAMASVAAIQPFGATGRARVAEMAADPVTGAYQFSLPVANLRSAAFGSGALPLAFSEVLGTGGLYTVEATAAGYVSQISPLLTLGATPTTYDLVLLPAP